MHESKFIYKVEKAVCRQVGSARVCKTVGKNPEKARTLAERYGDYHIRKAVKTSGLRSLPQP